MNRLFASIAQFIAACEGLVPRQLVNTLILLGNLLEPLNEPIVRFDRPIYRSLRRACCPHRLQQQSTDIRHGLGVAGIKRIILLPWFSQTKDLSYTKLGSY